MMPALEEMTRKALIALSKRLRAQNAELMDALEGQMEESGELDDEQQSAGPEDIVVNGSGQCGKCSAMIHHEMDVDKEIVCTLIHSAMQIVSGSGDHYADKSDVVSEAEAFLIRMTEMYKPARPQVKEQP